MPREKQILRAAAQKEEYIFKKTFGCDTLLTCTGLLHHDRSQHYENAGEQDLKRTLDATRPKSVLRQNASK